MCKLSDCISLYDAGSCIEHVSLKPFGFARPGCFPNASDSSDRSAQLPLCEQGREARAEGCGTRSCPDI